MIDMSNNDGFCLLDGRIVANCEHESCEDCEIYQDYVKCIDDCVNGKKY